MPTTTAPIANPVADALGVNPIAHEEELQETTTAPSLSSTQIDTRRIAHQLQEELRMSAVMPYSGRIPDDAIEVPPQSEPALTDDTAFEPSFLVQFPNRTVLYDLVVDKSFTLREHEYQPRLIYTVEETAQLELFRENLQREALLIAHHLQQKFVQGLRQQQSRQLHGVPGADPDRSIDIDPTTQMVRRLRDRTRMNPFRSGTELNRTPGYLELRGEGIGLRETVRVGEEPVTLGPNTEPIVDERGELTGVIRREQMPLSEVRTRYPDQFPMSEQDANRLLVETAIDQANRGDGTGGQTA